ncbi:MAG TPA: hypothetical protein VGF48_08925 [Thermoanaerobaculia bacterium]|jgi:hypothetical protein
MSDFRGAGGTEGGIGMFFIGAAMAIAGAYLLLNQVTVTHGGWSVYGYNAFGLALLPLILGIGLLFFSGRSVIGWLLTFVGVVIVFAGIIGNLSMYYRSTSLFHTLGMFVLLAGGIGLVARALKPSS